MRQAAVNARQVGFSLFLTSWLKLLRGGLFAVALLLTVALRAWSQSAATVTIQADQPGAVVSSNLFGIFFEEINYAGDGGVYAEMVRNRSFAESSNPDFWSLVTSGTAGGTMSVDTSLPLNTNNLASLKLTMSSGAGSVGAVNSGYFGMSFQAGATYYLNFYARTLPGNSGAVQAQLQNSSGSAVYAQAAVGNLTTGWQHYTVALVSSSTDTNGQLVLSLTNVTTVWLGEISLFPQVTFDNRTNGLRTDLANLLVGLSPSFMRYPGGNFIEANNLTNAVRWKNTIGDIASRPGHLNDAWGYWSTDGYGLDEAFRQGEDMGMQLHYSINAGLSLGYNGSANNTVPLDEMGPWVQDSLDLIQYATGGTNTTWGALRAANGHPKPYSFQYMEIGNENGGSYYNDRYAMFYDAIKSNYPSMHLIACDWGGIPTSRPVEIQDEHYYSDPATFVSYATKYDSYSRSGPKVFVGEYAVTSGYGTNGNLSAALGEASFMTGMERNSDLVLMASYAPLFGNINGLQWQPDLIYYDSSRSFGTPSYYVQKLFSQNRGNVVLPATVVVSNSSSAFPAHGGIGLGSWNTSVEYTNVVVTSNGVTLYHSDFINQGTNGWNVFNGTWSANNGVYQQNALITDCFSTSGNTNWANYTITLQAMKTGGSEGFLILFNVLDDYDWTWWNIGGWGNTLDGVEQMVGGAKTTYAQVSQNIAANTWYNIRIVVSGLTAQCYLGTNAAQAATNLVQNVTLPNPTTGILVSPTYAQTTGQIIVKAVNPYGSPLITTFNLAGVNNIAPVGTLIQLTSASAADENSFAAPTYVSPVTNSISGLGTNFTVVLPANSLSIFRLNASGINNYTNLLLQFPSPITTLQSVASTVWGQKSGNWINLTTNSNHAITWSSANTNVAVVDINGNVTGVGSGTTVITASYPALGLCASQSIQVTYTPVTLAHRYSMNETSGTNVFDSVGGPAWNGTLPNGGTFGGGELTFSSASQQYLNLPGGILSNYVSMTIEMWIPGISGSTTSPPFVYLFSFGDTDSSGDGYDYIFFNPNFARAAISALDPGYEGEQGGSLPFSLGLATNLHLTCVFDCPNGLIDVYTNGDLAATFSGITDPLSSVGAEFAYIGRSLYDADAYLNWSIEELRIYKGALGPAEIAATDALGPNQLLITNVPTVSISTSVGNLSLSWPLASAGYTVLTTTNLSSSNWMVADASPEIVAGKWQFSMPVTNSEDQFFRLQR